MNKTTYKTTLFGKWILSGEHAVLRGHPAIIFPVKTKKLELAYYSTEVEIRAEFSGNFAEEIQLLFWSALERAIEILDIQHHHLHGKLLIENNVPVGAGMGASGALGVAVGRWLQQLGDFAEANLFEFSRQLENLFHGESSGADIAAAIAGSGIYFSRSGAMHAVKQAWQPKWYLSFSEKPSATSRCVKKVKEKWDQDPKKAAKIDVEMAESVQLAEKALASTEKSALNLLAKAINQSHQCFKAWGLCEGIVENHINTLKQAGALAAKPTGSGDGGFILSLWAQDPPKELLDKMIFL